MVEILLVIALVWLLTLTLAFLGVTRHLGTIQAARGSGSAPESGFLFDTDGPWIPSRLPHRAIKAFRAHGVQTDDIVATFFSSRCGTCVERAEQVAKAVADPGHNVFLVTGADLDTLGIGQILEATGVPIIQDPDAHDIVKSLEINSTPFTFRVIDGQVVAKGFVRGVEDYLQMLTGDVLPEQGAPLGGARERLPMAVSYMDEGASDATPEC